MAVNKRACLTENDRVLGLFDARTVHNTTIKEGLKCRELTQVDGYLRQIQCLWQSHIIELTEQRLKGSSKHGFSGLRFLDIFHKAPYLSSARNA